MSLLGVYSMKSQKKDTVREREYDIMWIERWREDKERRLCTVQICFAIWWQKEKREAGYWNGEVGEMCWVRAAERERSEQESIWHVNRLHLWKMSNNARNGSLSFETPDSHRQFLTMPDIHLACTCASQNVYTIRVSCDAEPNKMPTNSRNCFLSSFR